MPNTEAKKLTDVLHGRDADVRELLEEKRLLLAFVEKVAQLAAASDYGRVEDETLLSDPSRNVWIDVELLHAANALLKKVKP